jgi:hypothetical protein
MRPKRTAEEMFPLAETYLQGGMTKKAYCAQSLRFIKQLALPHFVGTFER